MTYIRSANNNLHLLWNEYGKMTMPGGQSHPVPRFTRMIYGNDSGETHPMHIHDVHFQILDVDGRAPSAGDNGWKDTVLVPAWGSARVISKFTDNTGVYVFHCHKLEHEDHAMMAQFEVWA